jgi:ADP-heptose:LPS heptosyltransferase
LQKIDGVNELKNVPDHFKINIFNEDFDELHGRFMDSAAVIKNLDLIITVDTAVAHLAGALGVPVWLMLPYSTDWRWIAGRTDSPWYPTMRIFKQPEPFNWQPVVTSMQEALKPLVEQHARAQNIGMPNNFTSDEKRLDWGNNLLNTGNIFFQQHNFNNAVNAYELLRSVFPNSAAINHNLGSAYAELNRHHDAITALKTSTTTQPQNADIHVALATSLLAAGDYANGWSEYEWRWQHHDKAPVKQLMPWWDGKSSLMNKRILLRSEGSLGDVIQFVRYAQLVKQCGAHVLLKTNASLVPLLKHLPYLDEIITTEHGVSVDYQISLMSLPAVFTKSLDTVPNQPYLAVPHELQALWRDKLQNRHLNIGLCWQADPFNDAQRPPHARRSIPLNSCIPILTLPGTTWWCLQQRDGLEQLSQLPAHCTLKTFDENFDVTHGAFVDTAAVIANLDLIVTVDTSVAHLAGALGKPVLLLLPHKADWRWMTNTSATPWYPTMELIRKSDYTTWDSVINTVKLRVQALLKNRKNND